MNACQCVLICVISVYEMDVKATDISVSTGLNQSGSLKRTKLKKHIKKKRKKKAWHSGSWSGDQMYFCNFFCSVGFSLILWTDQNVGLALETCQSAFLFPFPPSCCRAPPARSFIHSFIQSGHCRFHVKHGQYVSVTSLQICTLHFTQSSQSYPHCDVPCIKCCWYWQMSIFP